MNHSRKRNSRRKGRNNRRKRNKIPASLPEDAAVITVSKASVDDVLEFQTMCQKWRALIPTDYFAKTHLEHSSSAMILVQETFREVLLLDNWVPLGGQLSTRRVSLSFVPYLSELFNLSCDGFILLNCHNEMQKSIDYIIFNPITREKVTVRSDISKPHFIFCGMFFSPSIKEYCCILWEPKRNSQFSLLNFGSQPSCRTLKCPTRPIYEPRNSLSQPPVVIDDETVYWLVGNRDDLIAEFPCCLELLLIFDLKTEEFSVMAHPGSTNDCYHAHLEKSMQILKIDGHLSFVWNNFTALSTTIDIWTLDSTATIWTKNYILRFNVDRIGGPDNVLGIMVAGKEELLLWRHADKRIYAFNLKLGTVRRIEGRYWAMSMTMYIPSSVLLGNCKSEIWV